MPTTSGGVNAIAATALVGALNARRASASLPACDLDADEQSFLLKYFADRLPLFDPKNPSAFTKVESSSSDHFVGWTWSYVLGVRAIYRYPEGNLDLVMGVYAKSFPTGSYSSCAGVVIDLPNDQALIGLWAK